MYIVTGGAGFIGSAMVWKLNQMGINDILIVDNLASTDKWKNLVGLSYQDYLHRDEFHKYLLRGEDPFEAAAIVHMGACSSTTQRDADFLMENNYRYSQLIARFCVSNQIPLVNASSAATYGDGTLGFSDNHEKTQNLSPLNMYGYSKHLFDLWALDAGIFDRIVSLKFFNVYGPNEYHKDDMRSVVCKAYEQILETEKLCLFKSYCQEYQNGGQKRDFVYVKDCVDLMWWFLEHPDVGGIFNVGTGEARQWNELAAAVFMAMNREINIEYIEMPKTIRNKYQYFTQAEVAKLRSVGYDAPFTRLEKGVAEYITSYLSQENSYLKSRGSLEK